MRTLALLLFATPFWAARSAAKTCTLKPLGHGKSDVSQVSCRYGIWIVRIQSRLITRVLPD